MTQTKKANIKELIPDSKNFNKHSEYGMSLLEKSVGKFGMGRSILLDKNNRIIAGNGITETAGQLGFEDVEIVESDGSKIIAVKRTDIDLDTPEGRELALADNATNAANLKWDAAAIKKAEQDYGIVKEAWGIQMKVFGKAFETESEKVKEVAEFPITILNSRDEYNKFIKIKEEMGMASNSETFFFIMNEFYTKHIKD